MPIDINQLKFLVKAASAMDPGSQAMAAAAQAAKPAGGIPLPKPVKEEEQKGNDDTTKMMDLMSKKEDQHRKELEKKENELRAAKHQLEMEQLDRKKIITENSLEQKQRQQAEQLRKERENLDNYKRDLEQNAINKQKDMDNERSKQQALQQAEQISHQAELAKATAEQKVNIAEEKAKSMMDISKHQANEYIKTTEQAKRTTDKYFAEKENQMKANTPPISRALQNQMDSAFNAVNRLSAVRKKLNAIPQPGQAPVVKMAYVQFCEEVESVVKQATVEETVTRTFILPITGAAPILKQASITTGYSKEYIDGLRENEKNTNKRIQDRAIEQYAGKLSDKAEYKSMQSADLERQAMLSDRAGSLTDANAQRRVAQIAQQRAQEQANKNKDSKNEAERADAFRFNQFNRRVWKSDLQNGNFLGTNQSARDAIINQGQQQIDQMNQQGRDATRGFWGKAWDGTQAVARAPWNVAKWAVSQVGAIGDDIVNGSKGFYDMYKTHSQAGDYNLDSRYATQANDEAGRSVLGSTLQLASGLGSVMTMGYGSAALRAGLGAAGRGLLANGARAGATAFNTALKGGSGIANSANALWQGAKAAAPSFKTYGANVLNANAPMMAPFNRIPIMNKMQGTTGAVASGINGVMNSGATLAGAYNNQAEQQAGNTVNRYQTYANNQMQQQQQPMNNGYQPNFFGKAASTKPIDIPNNQKGIVMPRDNMTDYNIGYDHNMIGNYNWMDSPYENTTSGRLVKKVNPFLKMITGVDLMKRNEAVNKGIWKPTPLTGSQRAMNALNIDGETRLRNEYKPLSTMNAVLDAHRKTRAETPYFNRIPFNKF